MVKGLDELDVAEVLTKLKEACGAGGTLKSGAIEIQGDQVVRIAQALGELGYRVRTR